MSKMTSTNGELNGDEDVLSQLNHEFKKAKVEQILKFLEDQEQLNKKFQEFELSSNPEVEEYGECGFQTREKYERQLTEIHRQAVPITHRTESPQDPEDEDNLDKYRVSSRRSKTSLGQYPSEESLNSIDSTLGQSVSPWVNPVSSAHCRRRQYRVSHVSAACDPATPSGDTDKRTLTRKMARPKSAYGTRAALGATAKNNPSTVGTSTDRAVPHSQPLHIYGSTRQPPEGAENAVGSAVDPDVFAHTFRNPFMLLSGGCVPSRHPDRKPSWDVVSDSVNVVRSGPRARPYNAEIDARLSGRLRGQHVFSKPSSIYGWEQLAPEPTEGLFLCEEQSKRSSSNGSTETFDPDELVGQGSEVTVGRYLASGSNRHKPEENLHSIIQWAPNHFDGRRGPMRRFISPKGDQYSAGHSEGPPGGRCDSSTVDLQKTKGIRDLRSIRGKARPLVFKLPPLEGSPVIKPTEIASGSNLVNATTRTVGGY